jgi:cytochrome c oxidase subunit 1
VSAGTRTAPPTPHWQRGRVAGWVLSTDHKRIGILWLGVAGVAVLVSGVIAVVVGIQTAAAEASFVGEGTYASLVTMEETLLQFFVLVPLVLGLAVFLVPLMVGARGIAAPGLASVGLWLGAFGALAVLVSSFGAGDGARSWWTTVPMLAVDPARGAEDPRLLGLLLLGLAVLATAVALVRTIRASRAPGMTLERLPLFAQGAGVYAVACLVLASLFVLANGLLLLERGNPGSFDWYLTDDGLARGYGWLFGQGIAAIALVPALAAAAEVVSAFAGRALPGRRLITLALVAAAVLLAIVPSADDVAGKRWAALLALIATIPLVAAALVLLVEGLRGTGRHVLGTPVPFALGGLGLTIAGAIVSLLLAVRHDELAGTTAAAARVEALWCGAVFALVGALVYWWPKLFGRLLDQRLVGLSFVVALPSSVLLIVGRVVAGEQGQPSRTGITTDDASAAGLVAAVGAVGLAAGFALFALAVARSAGGRRAGNDPWQADTLEWYTTSPPPPGNFTTLPAVESARPLDDLRRTLREKGAL